jgi:hypothetical protein
VAQRLQELGRFILFGMAITLAVAWSIAALRDPYGAGTHLREYFFLREYVRVQQWQGWGASTCLVVRISRDSSLAPWANRVDSREHAQITVPDWCDLDGSTLEFQEAGVRAEHRAQHATGFPFLAFKAEVVRVGEAALYSGQHHARYGIPTGQRPSIVRGCRQPRLLPVKPIWIGFAANSLLYAGVAYFVVRARFHFVRIRRIDHDQCPSCGYPIPRREHVRCPECGAVS